MQRLDPVPTTPASVTEILSSEHRVIELVLGALEAMAERAFTKSELVLADARDAVLFLRTFADACHHGKEEARLFPAMERHGLPAGAGPTAVMRREHDMGRAHVRKMDEAVTDFEKGAPDAATRFAFEARGFVELLREHIAKEDQVLFPMADRMLPAAVQAELLRDFDHVETHDMGPGTHDRFAALAVSLAERYGVTTDAVRAAAHTCGCAHHGR